MSDPFILILMTLTTFRITWLVTKDSLPFVKLPRQWFITKAIKTRTTVEEYDSPDDRGKPGYMGYRGGWYYLAELVTCPWCVSVWVAGMVTLVTTLVSSRGLSMPWLWFGATAGGAALIAQLLVSITDRE